MKRRGFFGAVAAALVAPVVRVPEVQRPVALMDSSGYMPVNLFMARIGGHRCSYPEQHCGRCHAMWVEFVSRHGVPDPFRGWENVP